MLEGSVQSVSHVLTHGHVHVRMCLKYITCIYSWSCATKVNGLTSSIQDKQPNFTILNQIDPNILGNGKHCKSTLAKSPQKDTTFPHVGIHNRGVFSGYESTTVRSCTWSPTLSPTGCKGVHSLMPDLGCFRRWRTCCNFALDSTRGICQRGEGMRSNELEWTS